MDTIGTREEPRHPIAIVSERTGLSPDVLRVWERRYAAVAPSRTQGGQRLYSDADIERLRLIHVTARAGRNIGQLAAMSTDALARLAAEDTAASAPTDAPALDGRTAQVIEAALANARELRSDLLADVLRRAATTMGVQAFAEGIAAPLMRRIGDEWHAGTMTVAQEHLATAVIHDLLVEIMRSFPVRAGARKVLIATPSSERHLIGAAIAGVVAAADGWNVVFLGADLPAEEIVAAAADARVSVVALSVIYAEERGRIIEAISTIRRQLDPDVRLLVGGSGAYAMAPSLRAAGAEVVSRFDLGESTY